MVPKEIDIGTPREAVLRHREALERFSVGEPMTPVNHTAPEESAGDELLPTPPLNEPVSHETLTPFRPVAPEDVRFARLKSVLDRATKSTATLGSRDAEGNVAIEIGFPILASSVTRVDALGIFIIRLALDADTDIKLSPTKSLELTVGGETYDASYMGDLDDFGGILPFRIISFVASAPRL